MPTRCRGMFVNSITIKNFRCFAELTLDDINVPDGTPASGLNLLIGENGNGKTTFLEAINLITQSSYTVGNILDVSDFTDTGIKIEVDYTSSVPFRCKMPDTYRGCYYDANGIAFSAKMRDKRSPGRLLSPPIQASALFKNTTSKYTNAKGQVSNDIPAYTRTYSADGVDGDSLNIFYFDKNRGRHLTQGTYKTTFERICDDLNWRFVKELNKDAAKKQALVDSLAGDFFDQARDAAQSGAGQQLADELAVFFDDVRYKSLRLDLVNYLRPFANGMLALREDDSLTQIMARDLGSGIEIIIALLMLKSISGASKGKIIYLIDEPEAHLHPKAQKRLLRLLVEEAKDKQIFVSTHSPYIFKDAFPTTPGMFIFGRDATDKIEIINANLTSFGHFPWSPSWGEVNFSAYDLPTIELHNELYGFIQEQTNSMSEQAIEAYFASRGISLSKPWIRMSGGTAQPPYNVTLLTYIRNTIHHPENTNNVPYTDVELRQSASEMMRLIEAGL
jgi:energy-coupling factor transporter ATP-binding protein EcfA2